MKYPLPPDLIILQKAFQTLKWSGIILKFHQPTHIHLYTEVTRRTGSFWAHKTRRQYTTKKLYVFLCQKYKVLPFVVADSEFRMNKIQYFNLISREKNKPNRKKYTETEYDSDGRNLNSFPSSLLQTSTKLLMTDFVWRFFSCCLAAFLLLFSIIEKSGGEVHQKSFSRLNILLNALGGILGVGVWRIFWQNFGKVVCALFLPFIIGTR